MKDLKKSVEKKVLQAVGSAVKSEMKVKSRTPYCTGIFHQPKRPKL